MKTEFITRSTLLCAIGIVMSTTAVAAAIPSLTLVATPATIAYQGNTTLVWSAANAQSCKASGGNFSGTKATSGSSSISALTNATTYSLTCISAGAKTNVTKSVTVSVAPKPGTSTVMPIQTAGSQLGINLGWVNTYSDRQNTFVDLMKQVEGPLSSMTNGNFDNKPVPVDANGWPTTDFYVFFINAITDPAGKPLGTTFPSMFGSYTLSFTGKATVGILASPDTTVTNLKYDAVTNTTTANVVLGPNAIQLGMSFTKTNGGVKNLKLLRPGYALGTTQVFTNEFLKAIAPFSTLRFMDFLKTNQNPVKTWADRTPGNQVTQGDARGVAWEYVIQLANVTGKDIWINIPQGVDLTDSSANNYVTQLAKLLKANLNPNIHVYVEYSNELWNFGYGFAQSTANVNQAVADVNSGADATLNFDNNNNKWSWSNRRTAHQIVRISDLFASVYGTAAMNSTIRPVYMSQYVQPWIAEEALYYIQRNFGSPGKYIYAIGGAQYFGPKGTETDLASAIGNTTASLNSILSGFYTTSTYNGSFPVYSGVTYGNIAKYYGLKHVSYEGGYEAGGTNAFFQAAANDHSTNIAIQQELADAFGCGNSLFMYFNLAGPAGHRYAIYTDVTVPTERSKALATVAATPLSYYNVCKPSATYNLLVQ